MNKYLMLAAAALLSSATTVAANTYCFQFTTANGGGSYCDGGRIYTGIDGGALNGAVRAWVHTNNNCSGGTSEGYGFLAKSPEIGKVSLMSDDVLARNYGTYSFALSWVLPKRIKNDQPWSVWVGFSGTTFFQGNNGTLVDVGSCNHANKARGRKSTLAALTAVIRAHRNARDEAGHSASAR